MRFRGFTLIELIVSVVILFLLIFFMANANLTLRGSLEQSQKYEEIEKRDYDFSALLIRDILQADGVNIARGREYDQLYLSASRNSLRGLSKTNIAYAALKPSATLIRIEAPLNFKLPIESGEVYKYHFLPFAQPLDSFKIYKSRKRDQNGSSCSLLIYIAPKGEDPKLFELGLLNASVC
jgi:prepilin-type N-terminal cleavage/methylation domain-containing protein